MSFSQFHTIGGQKMCVAGLIVSPRPCVSDRILEFKTKVDPRKL